MLEVITGGGAVVSVGSNLVVMRQYLVWLQLPVSLSIASLLPSPIVSLLLTSLTVHVQGGEALMVVAPIQSFRTTVSSSALVLPIFRNTSPPSLTEL